ncbi:unnamed protein product [Caenorhabditis angaria]|uniref:7TM GPCR serpentine receptor class x (Srx) domain-containing protein n=1 Tax=Caenorhabditis angaria TaxID=860376 RepID=A0A9P1J053_9PELO|nr:unnamed protein product [Caenorhabditis angaria]
MLSKTSLGFLIFLISFVGILANIFVLRPVYKLAINPKKSSIYVISFFNILADIVNLSQSAFYLAPCIIFESYIFETENDVGIPKFMGFLIMLIWYIGNITQIVMATNRYVVICSNNHKIFTRQKICLIFVVTLVFATVKAYIIEYVFPCCVFVFDHEILSYSYIRVSEILNYTDLSDLPLNALSTIVAVICYTSIIYKIHKSNKIVIHLISYKDQKQRRNKEFIYAMQFFSISLFYTFAWVFLRLFPVLFGGQNAEWFSLIAFCVIINSSANAFIYLIFNQEISEIIKPSQKQSKIWQIR